MSTILFLYKCSLVSAEGTITLACPFTEVALHSVLEKGPDVRNEYLEERAQTVKSVIAILY